MSHSKGRRLASILGIVVLGIITGADEAEGYTMIPRWGHASTYIPSPPTLLIQGGKTDPTSSYTYTSSPNSGDVIILSLTSPFTTSSPPFSLLDSSNSPTSAWSTLNPLVDSNDEWSILSFGGDGGVIEPVQTQADSAWMLSLNPANQSIDFSHEPSSWGNQPIRRIYHSSAAYGTGGKAYISGGLKDDGSGAAFADVYQFDPSSSSFSSLSGLPQALYHHSSVLLTNGTLLVMGGVYTSPVTGSAAALPFSTLYVFDTNSATESWTTLSLGGTLPTGRRGATAVLNGDGTKLLIFGGADPALALIYGDGWELDLATCMWQQVITADQGAGERFDHSAAAVGVDQVIIFGGYGPTGPASSDLYIYDMSSSSWLQSFNPAATISPSSTVKPGSSTSTTLGTATASGGSTAGSGTLSDTAGGRTATDSGSTGKMTSGSFEHTESVTQLAPSSSSSIGIADARSPLSSTPVRVGLILGVLAVACLIAGGLLYRHRRRCRRFALLVPVIGADPKSGQSSDRPYGSREKGGAALMEEDRAGNSLPLGEAEKPAMAGPGMGAIGASLALISSRLTSRQPAQNSYDALNDEANTAGPSRNPTRRMGTGIRLVGPRHQTSESNYAPVRLGSEIRPLSTARSIRRDILQDEDSRNFAKIKEEDWALVGDESESHWRSADSLLGRARAPSEPDDPFEDDDESLRPPMRGGPVPTPQQSLSDLDPLNDSASRRSSYAVASRPDAGGIRRPFLSGSADSDLSELLAPAAMTLEGSDSSLARSSRSGQTASASDAEEGVVQHTDFASQHSASLVSPVETQIAYVPIKRSESFFQRMTTGGIASLLSRQSTNTNVQPELNIRDPAPLPTLWRIDPAQDESYPPSSWDPNPDGLRPPQFTNMKGPSLSSMHSARSMRDMVIMQREGTISSIETEAIIETLSPVVSEDDRLSPSMSGSDYDRPEGAGHHRHGLTIGSEPPGSIVYNGAEFASPALLPARSTGRSGLDTPILPMERPIPSPLLIPSNQSPSTPKSPRSVPPADSPVPNPFLSHRRPVRDVVNSINKRASATPLSLFSPASQYSPIPVSPQGTGSRTPGPTRPSTMYEAVRRSPLTVANPDGRGARMSSS